MNQHRGNGRIDIYVEAAPAYSWGLSRRPRAPIFFTGPSTGDGMSKRKPTKRLNKSKTLQSKKPTLLDVSKEVREKLLYAPQEERERIIQKLKARHAQS